MNKNIKITLTILYSWFFASSIFCFLLDFIMSVVSPEPGHPMGYGRSLENQLIYISVWTTFCVAFWGLFNLIALYNSKAPKWFSSKNNFTFLVAVVTMIFFIYGGTMVMSGGVVGFDTWYKILKSTIEHFINPTILVVMYFAFNTTVVSSKHYARTDAWYVMIYISVYVIAMIIRETILRAQSNDPWTPFPYAQIDPWTTKAYLWIPALIAFEFVPYGLEIAYNALSNLSAKPMSKRFNKWNKKAR